MKVSFTNCRFNLFLILVAINFSLQKGLFKDFSVNFYLPLDLLHFVFLHANPLIILLLSIFLPCRSILPILPMEP